MVKRYALFGVVALILVGCGTGETSSDDVAQAPCFRTISLPPSLTLHTRHHRMSLSTKPITFFMLR
ncbi:hypothetical protein JCM19037_1237 [Geomicrobium sp. JCM 19037]|nr:hypothetical protein JCM19037_1237 [Geomicrobium sp. JCM 19037]